MERSKWQILDWRGRSCQALFLSDFAFENGHGPGGRRLGRFVKVSPMFLSSGDTRARL